MTKTKPIDDDVNGTEVAAPEPNDEVDNETDAADGDPFNPSALRLSQDPLAATGVKKALIRVPVRRPGPQEFFRVHSRRKLPARHRGDRAAGRSRGLPAAATALHRDGITQVVGYFGPVLDELSTGAERAFYAELAAGRRARDAVRAARLAMSSASVVLATVEHIATQRQEVRQPAAHLLLLVQLLLEARNRPLVLYIDNLETLQKGPKTGDPDAFADWRDAGCVALWRGLRELVRSHPGLALLASTRFPNRDFGAVVPFRRLPDDALWRMLAWFPSLRRLSEQSRAGLVARLAGHPRAVEFLDALIDKAILDWEYNNGVPFEPGCLSTEKEQAEIVERALPELDAQLSEDLLFDALWNRVLDAPARDLLIRVGVLRRPGDLALLAALAGDAGKPAIDKLRVTAMLTEIREPKPTGRASPSPSGWRRRTRATPLGSATCRCRIKKLASSPSSLGRTTKRASTICVPATSCCAWSHRTIPTPSGATTFPGSKSDWER